MVNEDFMCVGECMTGIGAGKKSERRGEPGLSTGPFVGSKRADDQKTEAVCLVKKSWAVDEGGEFFSGRCVRCAVPALISLRPEILLNVKFFSNFVIAVRAGLAVIATDWPFACGIRRCTAADWPGFGLKG